MQTDNQTLAACVQWIFQLSVHPDIPNAERKQYDALGYRLRLRLVTLLSAKFDDGTPQVIAANKKIKEVNALLKKRLQGLQGAAETVGAIGDLVSIIDDLFQLPFTFV